MKLFFTGHQEKYAVEQTLLTLFPGERPEYPDSPPGGDNELELKLTGGKAWFTAGAVLRREGKTFRGFGRVSAASQSGDPVTADRLRRRALQRAFYRAAVAALGAEPPWGMLSGVRPVKLPVRAVEGGATLRQAEALLRDKYRVSAPRRKLAMDCARASLKVKTSLKPAEISLYVGIPFCPTRCAYCSFISAAGNANRLIPAYLEALYEEIDAAGESVRRQGLTIRSVYIGGGTPTTLSPEELAALMERIRRAFPLPEGGEYTVEAGRPDTITREKLGAILAGGGNRISVNPQSLSDEVLKAMGRSHTAEEIRTAYALVRQAGFRAVNMDLIAGLPRDTPAGFQKTLDEVVTMAPENITVHTLALKRGSRLTQEGGGLPSGAEVARMLDYAWDELRRAGYTPYYLYRQKFMSGSFENVGWCKPGYESIYNICMMEELHSVLSLGAGGVTKAVDDRQGVIRRLSNPKYPQEYIRDREKIAAGKAEWRLRPRKQEEAYGISTTGNQ